MQTVPLSQAKARLSELVELVDAVEERVTITRNGRPIAIVLAPRDLEGIEETVDLLTAEGAALGEVREAEAAIARGQGVPLEHIASRPRRHAG